MDDILEQLLQAQRNVEQLSGFQAGVHTPDDVFEHNKEFCYAADNNFAYKMDVYERDPTPENKKRVVADSKMFNFVPTYDRWCLWCDKRSGVTKRCGQCHSVYFCSTDCQRKAWPVHKNHCGRDLFSLCAKCGGKTTAEWSCCDACPVKWCSDECRGEMLQVHKEYDCDHLRKQFGRGAE